MLSYLKRLLFDETAFIGLIRGIIGALGLGIESGRVPFPEEYAWVGLFAVGGALFMRSKTPLKNGGK